MVYKQELKNFQKRPGDKIPELPVIRLKLPEFW